MLPGYTQEEDEQGKQEDEPIAQVLREETVSEKPLSHWPHACI